MGMSAVLGAIEKSQKETTFHMDRFTLAEKNRDINQLFFLLAWLLVLPSNPPNNTLPETNVAPENAWLED